MFPLQVSRSKDVKPGPLLIPWAVAEIAYGAYARENGRSQSLERLAERGGFGWNEMDLYHPGWRDDVDEITNLTGQVQRLRQALLFAKAYGAQGTTEADDAPPCTSVSYLIDNALASTGQS